MKTPNFSIPMIFVALITFFYFKTPLSCASWAEQTLAQLTLKEKIAQVFMASVAASPPDPKNCVMYGFDPEIYNPLYIDHLIKEYKVGGIILMYSTRDANNPKSPIEKQVDLINSMQATSKIPLLCGQDCEWGLDMRIEETLKFPKNMTLGAIQDNNLVFQAGQEIGRQCKAAGIHINFAPVVDINNNPKNPIIGMRSFGADKKNVAKKGIAFTQGMQSVGTFAIAKHFPGHGDVEYDTHHEKGTIMHSLTHLINTELYPFTALINNGVCGIMSAHIEVPALGCKPGVSATLSPSIITDLLRKQLGFQGLAITDGMHMKSIVADPAKAPAAALEALKAGNDIILCPLKIKESIEYIEQEIVQSQYSEQELDKKVLKILQAKEHFKLHENRFTSTTNIDARIHNQEAYALKKLLFEKAITVIHNESQTIPLHQNIKIMCLDIGQKSKLNDGTPCIPLGAPEETICATLNQINLQSSDCLVIRIFQCCKDQGKFGKVTSLDPTISSLLNQASLQKLPVILMLCTSPYGLKFLPQLPTIVAYENDADAVTAAMNILYGTLRAEGILPIPIA